MRGRWGVNGERGRAPESARGHFAALAAGAAGGLGALSAIDLSAARPRSRSSPIILSMFVNSRKPLPMKLLLPSMAQVALVPCPSGTNVNVTVLVAANGFKNSSLIPTSEG